MPRNNSINDPIKVFFQSNKEGLSKLIFIDENDYQRKSRALRRYYMSAYKELCFGFPHKFDKKEGTHEYQLPTQKLFEQLYGKIKVIYETKGNKAVIFDIQPAEYLLEGYRRQLEVYKGIYIIDKKDKFKIDMLRRMNNDNR